jgi:hypothetical protein
METHPQGCRPGWTGGGFVSIVLTPLDGKPSDQTMGIKKIDGHHTVTVVKIQGKEMAISKSELSPDGKVLTVENDYATSNPNGLVEKQIQYWDRQ